MSDHLAGMDEEIHTDADETDLTAVVDDHQIEEDTAQAQSFWQKLRQIFLGGADGGSITEERLSDLNTSIALHPDVAMNYILRGELRLKRNDLEGAQQDFQQGLILAETALETDAWGFADQILQDRARRGLELTRRKINAGR